MEVLSLLLLFQSATVQSPPAPLQVQQFCARTNSRYAPSPIDESYRVMGMAPKSGALYSGTLSVTFSKGRYVLVRKAGGTSVTGEAWAVSCGPDRVPLLQVRYDTKPVATRFFCNFSVNYDNYSLANCGPTSNTGQAVTGLEAWFPAPGKEYP